MLRHSERIALEASPFPNMLPFLPPFPRTAPCKTCETLIKHRSSALLRSCSFVCEEKLQLEIESLLTPRYPLAVQPLPGRRWRAGHRLRCQTCAKSRSYKPKGFAELPAASATGDTTDKATSTGALSGSSGLDRQSVARAPASNISRFWSWARLV